MGRKKGMRIRLLGTLKSALSPLPASHRDCVVPLPKVARSRCCGSCSSTCGSGGLEGSVCGCGASKSCSTSSCVCWMRKGVNSCGKSPPQVIHTPSSLVCKTEKTSTHTHTHIYIYIYIYMYIHSWAHIGIHKRIQTQTSLETPSVGNPYCCNTPSRKMRPNDKSSAATQLG